MSGASIYRSYSPAFRYPLVIGKVNGLQLPVRFTVQQAAAFLISIVFGFKTRNLWGAVVPVSGFWTLLIIGGFSVWVSWLIQYKQIEGRHPLAFVAGWAKYLLLNNRKDSTNTESIRLSNNFKNLNGSVRMKPKRVVMATVTKPKVLTGWEVFSDA